MPHGVTPNMSYWLFTTITGITGVALFLNVLVYFALNKAFTLFNALRQFLLSLTCRTLFCTFLVSELWLGTANNTGEESTPLLLSWNF